ncbi:hypothetical protein B0A48_05778 [Cryoendolithus antarcticus]|uniref:Small ribosomal subunit protein mS41 n=1 Tax=Cryoendolithus antarcticus TaxID=1507870 RepID=A0A1V8TCA2_9PEZI|nr:hypothetical protein B0A48_05778 [Cryoendolithus antarcticus]
MASKLPLNLLTHPPSPHVLRPHLRRALHAGSPSTPSIPKPTPFVPDPTAFLTLIGRNLSAHASKIPSWPALFTYTSSQLREAGVEPARARRYLLWWRDRYRNGIMGIGGDLTYVEKGVAELRVVEVQSDKAGDREATVSKSEGVRKVVVNTPISVAALFDPANPKAEGEDVAELPIAVAPRVDARDARPVEGVKFVQGGVIAGRGVEYVKGHPGVARIRVTEGLWENRRGHKVDGGERRKAEVRAKRAATERKNAR